MPMGWWRPYFFVDLVHVQLLLEDIVLDGSLASTALASLCIAGLTFADRWLAYTHKHTSHTARSHAVLFTLQKCTGGMLMLLLMSFNVILFIEVVLLCGLWEYLLF